MSKDKPDQARNYYDHLLQNDPNTTSVNRNYWQAKHGHSLRRDAAASWQEEVANEQTPPTIRARL